MNTLLAVFIGGGLGSLARFGIGRMLVSLSVTFPWGTLLSNFLSCVVMGATAGFFSDKIFSSAELRFFILTGFCGGMSTFSTFSNETLDLFRSGNYLIAASNIILNIAACVVVLFIFTKK